MNKILVAVFALFLTLGLGAVEAEAARMGGGKSFGMQRQSIAPRPATPARQAAAPAPANPAGAAAATPKRNWMGPIAGLAAGLGIAALLSHFGMGAGVANFLMIALLAMAAVFVFKWLFRRNNAATQPANSMQYAGAGHSAPALPGSVAQFGSSAPVIEPTIRNIPESFDTEGFLRIAKLNFVRLQASNDAKSLDDIREFVSPELYAEIKLQMDERGDVPQQTDIVTLQAELLDVSTESNRYVASVHFSGTIREVVGGVAAPFEEIWNLSKPVDGGKGWTIAGIQQL
jgi:predicted lipid-binding transport protein (Tim44 family)